MIQANINDRYAQLSQKEKAELIGIYTRAGYRDLASIIAHYNSCGGKLYASGGPVTNTARYRDDSYLYNPPADVGAPIETPLRYRPLPDYGDYEPQTTSGMAEEMPIDLNVEIPERGYGVLLPEQPVTVPALDARKDAARRIMAVENSKNNVNGGYDAKTGRWYPHKSHEGGADTIAYGIKLSNGTPEAAVALKQGYLTDEQATHFVDTLVQKHYNTARKYYNEVYGEGAWDKLSDKSQSILVDYSYNPGLSKFPKLMEAFHSGDKEGILREYKRYSDGKPLGRNDYLLDEINQLEDMYPILRAGGGRLYEDGGENKYPTSSTVSYLRGLADYVLRRKTPRSFIESEYRPTLGDNGEAYYTRPGLKNEVILNLLGGSDYGKGFLGQNYFYKDFDDAYNSISGHPMNRDMRATSNGTLGQYSVTTGTDNRGRYLSFTDKFDHVFIPGDPIHIYDRIYEDEVPLLYNAEDSAIDLGDALSRSPRLKKMKASGGEIHIKPENRGKFTALKKRTGHSASWFKAYGTPAQKKMATFALNARKWKHEDGGPLREFDNISGLF